MQHQPQRRGDVESWAEQEEIEFEEEMAWSDDARVNAAVHVSAALMAWTFASSSCVKNPWLFSSLFVYASVTAATQRNRRSLNAVAQVILACVGSTAFAMASPDTRQKAQTAAAFSLYASEVYLWKDSTADLVTLAFPRFQRLFFATIVVANAWAVPVLYAAAEKLESDATPVFAAGTPEGIFQQLAAVILYGGTAFLLGVTAAIWARLYRFAPDLFRVLVVVILAGASVGFLLKFIFLEPDETVLTGASAASFVAMSFCILYDRQAAHVLGALAAILYLAARPLERPDFAALCFFLQLLIKLFFSHQLHQLGVRRQRYLPALPNWPAAALLFPAAPAATTTATTTTV